MRKKKSQNAIVVLFIAVSVVIIALMLVFALDYVKKYRSLEDESGTNASLREENESLEGEISSLLADKAELEERIARLEAEIFEMASDIAEKDGEIDRLLGQYVSDSEVLAILNDKIAQLESEAAEKDILLDNYKDMLSSSTGYRTDLVTELMTLLLREAPMRKVAEEGQEDLPKEERTYVDAYPKLSYYYYDLTSGYTVSYNADEATYSASVVKAIYIYSILREIEAFENNKYNFDSAGNRLYSDRGEPLFDGEHPNLDEDGRIIYLPGEEKYDLLRTWTYDKDTMTVDGSSEIKHMEDGATMTWGELIEYTLRYSDNIAFKQIRDLWGYTPYYNTVGALGLKGPAGGFMQLSAEDCVKFLKALYEYFDAGSEYAVKMRDYMIRSTHTVIIPCCYPTGTVAHKYGWDVDAYHDMAIVFDEHPYALVILSDLDTGGEVVNSYLRRLVDLTKRIHASAYQ